MKKILISLLSLCLLASCGRKDKKDPEVTPDSRESVSISETDFTQSDAQKVFAAALDEYCGQNACKAVSVRIAGKDITGTYTYTENGQTRTAEGTLYDVSVNPSDKTKYSASKTEFKGKPAPEPSEDPEDKDGKEDKDDKDDKDTPAKRKFDLDDKVDESDENARNDTKVYEENGIQIWRLYTRKGTIEFSGSYEGDSKFLIQIMDLKQNIKGEPVNMTKAGEIEGEMKIDEGYYYILIEASGAWSLYWNRTYE